VPTLSVDLNADGVHSIEAPPSFETDRPFTVELDNHGQATHVFLNLDEELSRVARLDEVNHYVDGDAVRRVDVRTREPDREVRGRLKLVTGHGAERTYVSVTVTPPSVDRQPVAVDESLAEPPEPEPESGLLDRLGGGTAVGSGLAGLRVDGSTLPVLALAGLAVAVAVVAGATIGSPPVLAGALVVVVGAALAVVLATR